MLDRKKKPRKKWIRARLLFTSVTLLMTVGIWIRSELLLDQVVGDFVFGSREETNKVLSAERCVVDLSTSKGILSTHLTYGAIEFDKDLGVRNSVTYQSDKTQDLLGWVDLKWNGFGVDYQNTGADLRMSLEDERTLSNQEVTLYVPMWFLFTVMFLLVAYYGYCLRGPRCHMAGTCHICGYDLRSSLLRCPECGAPSDSAAKTGS